MNVFVFPPELFTTTVMQIFNRKMQIYEKILAGHSEDGKHLTPPVKTSLLDVFHEMKTARLVPKCILRVCGSFMDFIKSSEKTDQQQTEVSWPNVSILLFLTDENMMSIRRNHDDWLMLVFAIQTFWKIGLIPQNMKQYSLCFTDNLSDWWPSF